MNRILPTIVGLLLAAHSLQAASLGTAFTYQGRLGSGANPVNGIYDFRFELYDALTHGSLVAGPVTNTAVSVTNGLFAAVVDFGDVFGGTACWMETSVRPSGGGEFTVLSPRQGLTPAPYARYAPQAGTAAVAGTVVAGGVTSAMIADGAVTSAKIGAAAVKPVHVDDGGSAVYAGYARAAGSLSEGEMVPFGSLSLVPAISGTPSFVFTLDGEVFGTAAAFVGTEGLSEPYEFTVEVIAPKGALNPPAQIGRQGRLTFTRNGQSTAFAGQVTGCALSSHDGTNALYGFRLEPLLTRLALNRDYRVNQDVTVPDLAANLYASLTGGTWNRSLQASYSPRANAIQYGETALNFLSRLLEEEGIFYFFEQGAGMPVLVMGDNPAAFPAASYSSLRYYGEQGGAIPPGAEFVRSFQASTRTTTRLTRVRTYDFKQPAAMPEGTGDGGAGLGEDYSFGSPWSTGGELAAQAGRQAERYQVERATRYGSGNAAGLRAGYTFVLDDRSEAGVGGTYLVTSVRHAGFRRETNGVASFYYGNQFEVLPAAQPYRPAFKTPRPQAQPCTAVVTGPPNEEIYVDSYGRVKVKFHWDRHGTADATSSAWVRVASPWAGNGHGLLFLPRVGDEVLVSFVQGNPDQPVITGSLYNGANTVPVNLPASKTLSVIKTRSSKGGGGANEIRFEDLKGGEGLTLLAAKDLSLSASNNVVHTAARDMSFSAANTLVVAAGNVQLLASQGVGIGLPGDPAFALKVNGAVAAASFQGGGSGLSDLPASALTGTIPEGRLPANAALRNGGNTFTGAQVIASGSLRLSDQKIFLRGGSDAFRGLGWYATGTFAGVNPDGPVLYGCAGGGLGSMCETARLALAWNNEGGVILDPAGANTGGLTPGLTFGPSGREGIASNRSATGNTFGLDFYTGGTNRLSLTSGGSLGLGTTAPARRLQVVDADGLSGSVQVGGTAAGSQPKLIYFGDDDYVHIGETGADDRLELKGTVVYVSSTRVGIANSNPTNLLMVGTARCDGSSWINSSDRNAKENIRPVSGREVLAKVAALPISRWTYKNSDGSAHLGPMAQDFRAAFGLGADETSIATVDADGVALAAVQGLNGLLREKEAEIQNLKERVERLEKLLTNLLRERKPDAATEPEGRQRVEDVQF